MPKNITGNGRSYFMFKDGSNTQQMKERGTRKIRKEDERKGERNGLIEKKIKKIKKKKP